MKELSRIIYTACPICGSAALKPIFKARDFTVSREEFEIFECGNCSLRFTQGAPDPDSIKNYYQSEEYISHSETRKGLVNRLYHMARNQTLKAKRKLVCEVTGLKKGELLDLGAGTGAFVKSVQDAGWMTLGLEPDSGARQNASDLHQVKLKPIEDFFGLAANSFDAITLWHVLEHIHDLHAYLAQLKKLLRPEGRILIAVPNYPSYDARTYKEYWAAYDVPRHLYHFSPLAMKRLLAQEQMGLEAIRGMWFDSFYISLLSEKYKTGKSNMARAFLNGAISNVKAWLDKETCSSLIYIIRKNN